MAVADTVDVRRLRRSALAAGIGDGLVAVGLPLLAAGATRDPLAVATVVAAQHLPWPLLALALPRLRSIDRRTAAGAAGSTRAVAVGLTGALAAIGDETILTLQLVALVLGVAQALTDDAERIGADLLVGRRGSGEHAALAAAGAVGLAVVGLPVGGLLYEALPPVPLLVAVAVFALAALGVLSPRRPLVPEPDDGTGDPEVTRLVPRPAPRTAPVTAAAALAAAAGGAVLGVLVLLALDDLGLGAPAFGLLLAGLAAASTVGALVAPSVAGGIGVRVGATAGLVVAAGGYAGTWALLDPEAPLPAVVALGVGTGGAMLATVAVRALLHGAAGRVVAGDGLRAFHLAVWAATPIGALAGGLLARATGVDDVLLAAAAACLVAGVGTATTRLVAPGAAGGDDADGAGEKGLDALR